MTWNYRIIHHEKEGYYGLHEVLYDDKGKIEAWTEEPEVVGDSVKEIKKVLNMMLKDAKTKRVLSERTLEAKLTKPQSN